MAVPRSRSRYAAGRYTIDLLLVQDAGGSTGMYRVEDGYLFAPEKEGTDGRPVCSVVCMRKKNKEDNPMSKKKVFLGVGHGGAGKTLAQNIEKHVKAIGQNSRGVKARQSTSGDYYAFICETVAPAVSVEGMFVDTKADAAQADTLAEQQAFGVAYVKGILDTLGLSYDEPEDESDDAVEADEEVGGDHQGTATAGLAAETMQYLLAYEYGVELVTKQAYDIK